MKNEKTWQEACYESANCQCIGRCMFRPVVIDETEQPSEAEIPETTMQDVHNAADKAYLNQRMHKNYDHRSFIAGYMEGTFFKDPLDAIAKLVAENQSLQSRVAQLESDNKALREERTNLIHDVVRLNEEISLKDDIKNRIVNNGDPLI